MMRWWQLLLFPFSILYNLITRFRNHLYDIGHQPSFEFEANVVSVGNLSVGGTGKTPMVAYLIDHFLKVDKRLATLSRGYGRKTKGFLIANENATAESIGDESMMYYLRYHQKVMVAVGEVRAMAIPEILTHDPKTDIILLDDAFQHRTVVPSVSILLTTYSRPFFTDLLLPAGRLRESRQGATRSDVVVVTKCPELMSHSDISSYRSALEPYLDHSSIFFSSINYGEPMGINTDQPLQDNADVILVSAIANPSSFEEYCENRFDCHKSIRFKDHYRFALADVLEINSAAEAGKAVILLTEKDATKWRPYLSSCSVPIYYLPISTRFLSNEEEFLKILDGSIKYYSRDYGDV
ncbi:MAG: tetraacyldisaccharide 4'-kinase [Cyclobacteriaceae bacterium]|jgi:tetraacyldisaccharide 4'-kinase